MKELFKLDKGSFFIIGQCVSKLMNFMINFLIYRIIIDVLLI